MIRSASVSLTLASFLLFGPAPAHSADDRHEYWTYFDEFFELLEAGEPEKAVERLEQESPVAESMADEMNNVKFQLAGISRVMGGYRSHEILIHKLVAERLAYIYVFVAYDRQPMKFEFHFYRPDEDWHFHRFSFSDQIEAEIVEHAKFELLNVVP